MEDRLRGGRQPEGADAADGSQLHRRVAEGVGGACARETAAVLLRLDADGEAAAEELHRHAAGQHVLRTERVDPAAGGRGAAERVRAAYAAGGGHAAGGEGVGGK